MTVEQKTPATPEQIEKLRERARQHGQSFAAFRAFQSLTIEGLLVVRDLLEYIDVLEGELGRAETTPIAQPTRVVGGWHSVQVIGEVGHSYGVARNEDGLLVIASKRSDKVEWAHRIKPKGDCWLTIMGGNTRWSVTYAPLRDRPSGS